MNPAVSAFYGENDHFILKGYLNVKSEFTVGSLCFYPIGKTLLTLKKTNEIFEITKPYASIHNMVVGTSYIWTNGDSYV